MMKGWTWCPSVPRKYPTPLHHHQQPDHLIQVIYAFMLFTPNSACCRNQDSSDEEMLSFLKIFCFPILKSRCELQPRFPVLSWKEWQSVWSFAATVHVLQVQCVVHLEMLFCITVQQTGRSPLTSRTNMTLPARELSLT